jgi:hypothetical protein
MQQAMVPVLAPGNGDAGRGGIPPGAVAGDDHLHAWQRLPDAVGLFDCRDRECLWYAVCPGCIRSLEVALRVRDDVVGLALYWCPVHQGGGVYAGEP